MHKVEKAIEDRHRRPVRKRICYSGFGVQIQTQDSTSEGE